MNVKQLIRRLEEMDQESSVLVIIGMGRSKKHLRPVVAVSAPDGPETGDVILVSHSIVCAERPTQHQVNVAAGAVDWEESGGYGDER